MLGGAGSVASRRSRRDVVRDDDEPWFEATIPELQALMASGQLTSRGLTLGLPAAGSTI